MTRKIFMLSLLTLILAVTASAKIKNPQKLVGTWTTFCSSAPYDYQKGEATITQEGEKLLFNYKGSMPAEINYHKGTYTSTFMIEGADVVLNFKPINKNRLEGVAVAMDSEYKIVFTKKKK